MQYIPDLNILKSTVTGSNIYFLIQAKWILIINAAHTYRCTKMFLMNVQTISLFALNSLHYVGKYV